VALNDDMEHQLAHLIARINRQIEEELEGRLRPEGISIEWFRVLRALRHRDGQAMGALAAGVLVDATTLTKMIDRMVSEALVYRAPDPDDRRRVLIFLARKGRVLADRLAPLVGEQQRQIFAHLKGNRAEELKRLLLSLETSAGGQSNRAS
jgi:DNA-binding MarR family transcriptional regulator